MADKPLGKFKLISKGEIVASGTAGEAHHNTKKDFQKLAKERKEKHLEALERFILQSVSLAENRQRTGYVDDRQFEIAKEELKKYL
jgi:hypothetical protein